MTKSRVARSRTASIGSAACRSTMSAFAPTREAVAFEPENARRNFRHRVEGPADRLAAGHRRAVHGHVRDIEHVGPAEAVPRVHDAILAERDRNAERAHFGDPRHAASPRIGIVAALQGEIDQRVGDCVDAGLGDQRQQLRHVVIVHRMHRRQMRSGRARSEAEPMRFRRQRLDVAGQRIVALVAMQVDHQPALRGDLAQRFHRRGAVGHRAFEMRDAADDVDAEIERALEVARGVGERK